MKFLITCDNCDGQFLTTAESGQTVQCQCPHCGGQMKVKLPEAAESPEPFASPKPSDAPASPKKPGKPARSAAHNPAAPGDEPRRQTGCGIVVGILIGLFLLVLIAMVVYSMTRTESTRPIEDPFQHVYEDTTALDDSFDAFVEERPDTVERHIEEPKEEEFADTADVATELALPAESPNNTENSELSETPDHAARSAHPDHPSQSDHPAKSEHPANAEQPTN